KKLEPAVREKLVDLMRQPLLAESLIQEAKEIHRKRTEGPERKKAEARIKTLQSQLDVLAERLAELPKSVSPDAIYRQMERLENLRRTEQGRLAREEGQRLPEEPAQLRDYRALLTGLAGFMSDSKGQIHQERVLRALVHKVEVIPEGFR